MAGTLALINPAKSKRRKRSSRSLPPRNKKGRFMKGGRRKSAARRAPARKRTYSRRRIVRRRRGGFGMRNRPGPIYVRPRKGRKGRTVYKNPRRYRRRRNPIGGNFVGLLQHALAGAVGATLVRTGINYLPAAVSGTLLTGKMRYVTQGAGAILLGIVAGMIPVPMIKRAAGDMALGALTVTLHEVIVNEVGPLIGQNLGGLGYWGSGYTMPGEISGLGYGGPGYAGQGGEVGEYVGPMAGMQGLGEYVTH